MEDDRLTAAVKAWQDIKLPALQVSLDAQGLEIVENQKEGLINRKKLAETTKEFRKVPDEEKLREFKTLLKAYQSEIDAITKRSKVAENAFLSLYKVFAEAPDPASLFETVSEQTKQISQLSSVQNENVSLREELVQAKNQLSASKKDEGNMATLKTRLAKYEVMLEEMVGQKVAQKEVEMKQAMDDKIRIYKETEYSLQRQVSQLKDQMTSLQTTHEVTQAQLVDHSEKYDDEVAAKLGELEIVMVDLDRSNLKVAQLERDNDILKADLGKYRGGEASGVEWQDPVILAKKLQAAESELTTRLMETEKLRVKLKDFENEHHQRVAEMERDLAVKTLEVKQLETRVLSYEDYDEIKRELEIVKSIEFDGLDTDEMLPESTASDFNSETPTSALSAPLERLLLGKNKKLQTALTETRVELSARQVELARLSEHLSDKEAENTAHKNLIKKLEEDMTKLEAMGQSGPRPPTSLVSSDGFSALVNSVIMPRNVVAQLPEGGPGAIGRGETSSIVPILTSQRDRYRQRNTELEEQLRVHVVSISDLRNEIERLKEEHVKLYERLRYAQQFSGGGGATSPGGPNQYDSHSPIGLGSSQPRSRGNQHQQSGHNTPAHSTIPIYETQYETTLDPFAQFHQQEKARRVAQVRDRLMPH
ncbi:hypothetical protein HKX48_006039 [Thoreauomyces humboldtii]|nr:hypothetical protein HKX48_006039 [Thoreauomyces humboldtii]